MGLNRRSVLGLGGAAAVGAATLAPLGPLVSAANAAERAPRGLANVKAVYAAQKKKAGGRWHSYVTAMQNGAWRNVIADDIDFVIEGASVQKLAVALAVLDKVDRGLLSLDQKLDLPESIILDGSGTYHLQAAFGDDLTIAGFLVAMLQVSDNTAVRMCGRVAPGPEINEILAAKGFTHTRVEPVEGNPNRFFLGTTTPREMHALVKGLADQTLLSASSTQAMLRVMRWSEVGYVDGVRRNMSSAERARIGIKYGANGDLRHEVGVIFDTAGAPILVFSYFADQVGDEDNYGATNPAVQAHAVLGRAMLDAVGDTTNGSARVRHPIETFRAADSA
ncbi:serine hydrolase [Actinomadura sp. HBU206391]|uniref:serine hydrolase n=1 Tax=Actinomadura sp. HBU206391 TaxID=2731692 RepID=UPI001650D44A|nr:serine hydrolase [Actinomadura sp. HBU206391]MBC6458333.1 serine hydrolase [Actinomadura sp. HBU206391]